MDSLELITDNETIYTEKNHPTKPNSLDYYILNQYKDGKYTPPVRDIKIIIIQLYIICLKLSESYPNNKNYSPDLIKIIYDQGGLPPKNKKAKTKSIYRRFGRNKNNWLFKYWYCIPDNTLINVQKIIKIHFFMHLQQWHSH